MGMFKALINEDYSVGIDIERYQGYGKTKTYNNNILVSNTDMKIGSNKDINRDHKKWTPRDVPKKIMIPAVQHNPPHKLIILTEKHNGEKLAITLLILGDGLIAYHFW